MRSTFSGLNTVVRALYAQQMSLDTVGHNIANADAAGYSRQRVNLAAATPETIYSGSGSAQIGTGVNAQSIIRIRDTFVDQQMWKESSTLGYALTVQDMLGKIQNVFQEPTETGMHTVLKSFWTAWNDVAKDSSDNSARAALRERAVELVSTIQLASDQLKVKVDDINSVIDQRVDTINQITSELLALNQQIVRVEAGGSGNANDLRDRRDQFVDQLSQMINVQVAEDRNGNFIIQSSGVLLVDGQNTGKLKTISRKDPDYGYEIVDVVEAAGSIAINFSNGEIKGLIDARDKTAEEAGGKNDFGVKAYLNKLSTISQFLLQDFNAIHRSGFGSDNSTGNNFFGQGGDNDPNYRSSDGLYAVFGVSSAGQVAKGDWIKALQVNADLFNAANGLGKIAAKTFSGTISFSQSNPASGQAAVGLYSDYTGGADYKQYTVTIGDVDSTGQVKTITYSVDGVLVNEPVTRDRDGSFHLANGVKITIADNIHNEKKSTYKFTVPQGNGQGDNATNLANRLETDTSSLLGNSSLASFYNSFIGALGVQAQNYMRLTTNQEALVNQITNWRSSVSGVNLDEELSNMIKFQKGYNSAARVLTTMDEMLDKLINGTGVVGR